MKSTRSLATLCAIAVMIFMARCAMRDYTPRVQKSDNMTPAKSYRARGTVHAQKGRYQEAISAYKQAIQSKPDYGDAHLELGLTYTKLGRYPEAVESFRHAMGLVLLCSFLLLVSLLISIALLAYGTYGLLRPEKLRDLQRDSYARHKYLGVLARLDINYLALELGGDFTQRMYSAGALAGGVLGFYSGLQLRASSLGAPAGRRRSQDNI